MSDEDDSFLLEALKERLDADRAYVRDFLEAKFGRLAPSRGQVLMVDRARGIIMVDVGREEACKAEVNRYVSIDWETPQ